MSANTGDGCNSRPQIPFGAGDHILLEEASNNHEATDETSQHAGKKIFVSCDKEQTGSVRVSVLIDFITPYLQGNIAELMKLKKTLDPNEVNPSIDIDTFCKAMKEWTVDLLEGSSKCDTGVRDIKKNEAENSNFQSSKSEFVSYYCNDYLNSSQTEATCDSSIYNNSVLEVSEPSHAQDHIKELQHQNRKLNEELAYMRSHTASLEEQYENLQMNCKGLKKQLVDLHQTNQQLQEKQQQSEAILDSSQVSKKEIEGLQTSLSSSRKETTKLKEQINLIKTENKKLQENYQALLNEETQSKMVFKELKSDLNLKENEVAMLEETMTTLKAKLQDQRHTIDHYVKTNELLKIEKTNVEKNFKEILNSSAQNSKIIRKPPGPVSHSNNFPKQGIVKKINQFKNTVTYYHTSAHRFVSKIPRHASIIGEKLPEGGSDSNVALPVSDGQMNVSRIFDDAAKTSSAAATTVNKINRSLELSEHKPVVEFKKLRLPHKTNKMNELTVESASEESSSIVPLRADSCSSEEEFLWNLQTTNSMSHSLNSLDEEILQVDQIPLEYQIKHFNTKQAVEYEHSIDKLTNELNIIKAQKTNLNETIQELQQKCKALESEIETLKSNNDQKYIKVVDLMKEIDELKNKIENLKAEHETEVQIWRSDKLKLTDANQKLEENVSLLREQKLILESMIKEANEMKCQNNALKTKYSDVINSEKVTKEELKSTLEKNVDLRNDAEKLQKQLDNLNAENADCRNKCQNLSKNNAWLQSELALNNEKYVQLIVNHEEIKLQLNSALQDNDKLKDELSKNDKNNSNLKSKYEDLLQAQRCQAEALNTLKEEKTCHYSALRVKEDELRKMESFNFDLNQAITEKAMIVNELKTVVENQQESIKSWERERVDFSKKLEAYSLTCETLNKEKEDLQTKLVNEIEQRNKLTNQLTLLKSLNKNNQKEIDNLKFSIKDLEASRNVLKECGHLIEKDLKSEEACLTKTNELSPCHKCNVLKREMLAKNTLINNLNKKILTFECEDQAHNKLGSFEKLKMKTERLQIKFETSERTIKLRNEKIAKLEAEVNGLREDLASKNDSITKYLKENNDLNVQKKHLNKQIHEILDSMKKLKEDHHELEQRMLFNGKENLSLKAKIKNLKEAKDSRLENSKIEIEKMKKKIDELTAFNTDLENKFENTKISLRKRELKEKRMLKVSKSQTDKMDELNEENVKLKEELKGFDIKYEEMEKQLKDTVDVVTKENTSMQREIDKINEEKHNCEKRLELVHYDLEKFQTSIRKVLSNFHLNTCGGMEDILEILKKRSMEVDTLQNQVNLFQIQLSNANKTVSCLSDRIETMVEFFSEQRLHLAKLTIIAFNAWKTRLENIPENQSLFEILNESEAPFLANELKEPLDEEVFRFKQQLDITSLFLETIASLNCSKKSIGNQTFSNTAMELQTSTMDNFGTVMPEGFNLSSNLSDEFLQEINLTSNNSAGISMEDMERKFLAVVKAFMLDVSSIKKRQQCLQNYRSDMEEMFSVSTERLVTTLRTIGESIATREVEEKSDLISMCLQQIEQIVSMYSQASSLAMLCGALQREEQLLKYVNFIINYTTQFNRKMSNESTPPPSSKFTSAVNVKKTSKKDVAHFIVSTTVNNQPELLSCNEKMENSLEQSKSDNLNFNQCCCLEQQQQSKKEPVGSCTKTEGFLKKLNENIVIQFILGFFKMAIFVMIMNIVGNVFFSHDDVLTHAAYQWNLLNWNQFWSHFKVTYPYGPPPT